MQAERQNFQGDREAMRAFMGEQSELRNAKYKEVLTEEQFARYTEMAEARRQQMRQQRPGGPDDPPAERGRGRGRGG